MIKKNSELYDAIYEAIYKIFDAEIELDDPTHVTELFVKAINEYLGE